jgi:hypothetical protein
MNDPKPLDFIIIGAQKSATTSLFKYLQPHPGIYMPPDKEAPYFSDEALYAAGWPAFVANRLAGADPGKKWGSATPQYMGHPAVAARIRQQMPDARLIALLRHPIERAYSHYTMSMRRGFDQRSFGEAVASLLEPAALAQARAAMPQLEAGAINEDESGHYLVWSEYGRILAQYRHHFPPEQLLVLYMDEMVADPADSYLRVVRFIGVDDSVVPDNVGKVYHKGGRTTLVPDSWRTAIKTNPLFRLFWDRVPDRIRQNIRYWYDQKNVRKGATDEREEAIDPATRQRLIDHFAPDIDQLERLTGRQVPWSEWRGQGASG